MNMDEYQADAQKTAIYIKGIREWIADVRTHLKPEAQWEAVEERLALCYAALANAGEAGEISQKVSKMMRDNTLDSFSTMLDREIGDNLWTLAAVATEAGVDLGQAAQDNLDKLADRKARNVLGGSGDNR